MQSATQKVHKGSAILTQVEILLGIGLVIAGLVQSDFFWLKMGIEH